MRKALIIGIDYYRHSHDLHGCVSDAHSVKSLLEQNYDGSPNFGVKLLTAANKSEQVTRAILKDNIRDLFRSDDEATLLYFAGHGHIEATGGYILSSDSKTGDDGIPLAEVMSLANDSKSRNKIIFFDSCHSGVAASKPSMEKYSELTEGMTILTASTAEQYANETACGGIFTNLLVDALSGAAGNLVGDVSPGSIYAHIDQSLGPWEQRPVFKTNVKSFVSLRKVKPPIDLCDLRRIVDFFPCAGHVFPLDPSYEPESETPDPKNTAVLAVLQKYNRVNLVVPVDAPHMYHAAIWSKGCRLTVLGEHYRRLAKKQRI